MAKHKEHPGETLEQIESAGDRMAEWIGNNPVLILGTALGILVLAGAWGFAASMQESSRLEASDALAALEVSYREAMGAEGDAIAVPEPANPETARSVRSEYVEKFRALAEEHAGTVPGDLAWIQVGGLQQELGDSAAAVDTWTAAAESATGPTTGALLLTRIAGIHEAEGRWLEAAASYEAAAQVTSYPLRYSAFTDAARCYAEANEIDQAIAALDRVETEAPDEVIPEHVRLRVEELRVARSDG